MWTLCGIAAYFMHQIFLMEGFEVYRFAKPGFQGYDRVFFFSRNIQKENVAFRKQDSLILTKSLDEDYLGLKLSFWHVLFDKFGEVKVHCRLNCPPSPSHFKVYPFSIDISYIRYRKMIFSVSNRDAAFGSSKSTARPGWWSAGVIHDNIQICIYYIYLFEPRKCASQIPCWFQELSAFRIRLFWEKYIRFCRNCWRDSRRIPVKLP